MKNQKKKSGLSALKLVLIITGSIIAAAGILFLILQICKKKCNKKAIDACCCEEDLDDLDGWDIDEDILSELDFDDDELCGCEDCADCSECAVEDGAQDSTDSTTDAE